MKRLSSAFLSLSLFSPSIPAAAFDAQRPDVEKYILPENGLTVILHRHYSSSAVVRIRYNAGRRNDPPGKEGVAHFVEHLFFEGSAHVSREQFFAATEGAGGRVVGFTMADSTDYEDKVPAERLEDILRIESDRMCCLNLTPQGVEKQRRTLLDEITQRKPVSRDLGMQTVRELLLDKGDPNISFAPDTVEGINAISLEDAARFYKTYYAPNNAVMVISGYPGSPEEALDMVKKWFGPIPRGAQAPRPGPPKDLGPQNRDLATPMAAFPQLYITYRLPVGQKNDLAFQILAYDLANPVSRFSKYLVQERKVASEVRPIYEPFGNVSLLTIYARPAEGVDLATLRLEILRAAALLSRDGLTKAEFKKARDQVQSAGRKVLQALGDTAFILLQGETNTGNPSAYLEEEKEVNGMNRGDPKRAARYLTPGPSAVVTVRPFRPGARSK